MENGYAAHWDATGTDLVTKGATNTHDLTVNGDASVSGTLTADLTGTADNATCFDGKTYSEAKTDILSGNAASATNATCFGGCTYSEAKTDILSGCAADSAKLGNKDPSCYIDTSSTAQTKAGNLCIGAPASCTSTSAGGAGTALCGSGVVELYTQYPRVEFHYNKYCGDYSSRVVADDSSLLLQVNDGKGCTSQSQEASYNFKSDGTFTGASKICASTDIYSNGCPVVTTGTLPTVAPGYNCTGTSNYVVTTMVCCACHAKTIDRTATDDSHDWHIPLTWSNTTDTCTSYAVSCGCPLTFNPAKGVLGVQKVCSPNVQEWKLGQSVRQVPATECYYLLWEKTVVAPTEFYGPIRIKGDYGIYGNTEKDSFDISIDFRNGNPAVRGTVGSSGPSAVRIIPTWDSSTNTARIYFRASDVQAYSGIWFDISCASNVPAAYTGYTSMSGTPRDVWSTLIGTCVNTSSSNAEYPLVFSTCCATPAAGNRTLYNDSANNLMYNPSSNTLITTCVRASSRGIIGTPTACTSTVTGIPGINLCSTSSVSCMTFYGNTPYINLNVNNANAEYTHRIRGNDGYLRITATNATGCTAATQTANFDFCSDGTLKATCFDGNAKTATGTSAYNCYCLDYYQGGADRSIVLSDACTSSATAVVAALGRSTNCTLTFNPATGDMCRNKSSMRGYGIQLPSATGRTMYALIDADSPNYNVIEGQIYSNAFAISKTCGGEYLYRFGVDCYGNPAVGHINNTTTCFWFRYDAWIAPQLFAKNPIRLVCTTTTAPSEITFCNSVSEAATAASAANAICFGGCTYAQACADIAGSVETTPYTCINDVNSGSQNILMTSSTGTLGIVNASTGTNACPLTYNPATGVLITCRVEAKSFKPTCYSWSQCITGIKLNGTTLCMCLA